MEDPYSSLDQGPETPRKQTSMVLVILGLLLAIGAVIPVFLISAEDDSSTQPNVEQVEVMFEVGEVRVDGTLAGTILEPVAGDGNAYTRSGQAVTVQWQQGGTEVIRGTVDDVYPGAVIQAIGYYNGNVLVAWQLVILTDVANVQ